MIATQIWKLLEYLKIDHKAFINWLIDFIFSFLSIFAGYLKPWNMFILQEYFADNNDLLIYVLPINAYIVAWIRGMRTFQDIIIMIRLETRYSFFHSWAVINFNTHTSKYTTANIPIHAPI